MTLLQLLELLSLEFLHILHRSDEVRDLLGFRQTAFGCRRRRADAVQELAPAAASEATPSEAMTKVRGVNYGNRFIPEDWMNPEKGKGSGGIFEDVPTGRDLGGNGEEHRSSLAHLSESQFRTRYIKHLEGTIQEKDFVDMKNAGVNAIRVPTGFWNWVQKNPSGHFYNNGRKNILTSLPPSTYTKYFDRIFQYANQNDIKVLLVLHGAPGSQNGEVHSGQNCRNGNKCSPEFDTPWNMDIALNAIEEMSKYGKSKKNLYGIQVLNEPNQYPNDSIHGWLMNYYESAIIVSRKHLPLKTPIVLFAWSDEDKFKNYPKNRFHLGNYDLYGNVIWDTHLYAVHRGGNDHRWYNEYMDTQQNQAMRMAQWQPQERNETVSTGGIIVGEWSLAGTNTGELDDEKTEKYIRDVVRMFEEHGHGSFYWNWDATSKPGENKNGWRFDTLVKNANFHYDKIDQKKKTI